METLTIKDENGKEFVFEKPECDVRLSDIFPHRIIGSVSEGKENRFVMMWGYDGKLHNSSELCGDKYNLKVYQEFTYPMWFKNVKTGTVARFDSIRGGQKSDSEEWSKDLRPHDDSNYWEQVEEPKKDETLDKFMNGEYRSLDDPAHPNNILSITNNSEMVYKFKKPAFRCEQLKVSGRWIIGTIGNYDAPCVWDEIGRCLYQTISDKSGNNQYDLTPIKKKWYEDESNFPALVTDGKDGFWSWGKEDLKIMFDSKVDNHNWRLATKEERDSLYCESEDVTKD